MSQTIHKIMYSSSAVDLFSAEALDQLMLKSRHKNAHFGVTGCLIYHDGNIIQYLEGSKASVDFIYGSIVRDSRHHDIHLLCNDQVDKRAFRDWSMALRYIPENRLRDYRTVYDLFEDMMETDTIAHLCREARVFFETFLDVSRLRTGNMHLS
ncbi:BLUF domain-containing protein [Methylophaga sp.]|uniref:BLUF domain-containing protein n=1 Tax=Methylophaga sp. TaxID=2024840 RepID=UPI001400C10D|nr:BLUF domain-containing protein [Methylophaga sp.]MTI63057.1 BLUF domain-containing protein [Methylophaga sp.]